MRPGRAEGRPGARLRCRPGGLGPRETIHGWWTESENIICIIHLKQQCVCFLLFFLPKNYICKILTAPPSGLKQNYATVVASHAPSLKKKTSKTSGHFPSSYLLFLNISVLMPPPAIRHMHYTCTMFHGQATCVDVGV